MSAGTAEAGRTASGDALHAVKPGLAGPQALCGDGRIATRVPGRYDPSVEGACPACAARLSAPGG